MRGKLLNIIFSNSVYRCLEGKLLTSLLYYLISFFEVDVSQGSTDFCNHGLRLWPELLEQSRPGDVVCVHVSVHTVLQAEAQVLDLLGIPLGCLDNLDANKLQNF